MPPVVALTELTDVDGRVIGCPAAPMVAGELRRRGVPVVTGTPPPAQRTAKVFTAEVPSGGTAAGIGVEARARTGFVPNMSG